MAGDCVEDHIEVAKDLGVPEAQDGPNLGFEPAIPNLIVGTFVVLFAVTFHDRSVCQACEVDDEPSDDHLPSKVTLKLTSSESDPQHCLRLGHVLSQFTCSSLENPGVLLHQPTVPTSSSHC